MDKKKNRKFYNPQSTELTKDRKIISGDPTGIFNQNDVKYQWAYNLWEVMINNTWFPGEVDMTKDSTDYKLLTETEKSAYDKVLAQLIFMDSLQTTNLLEGVSKHITAPEISMCVSRQIFEECLHTSSYSVMVDSISTNTKEIYELWRNDPVLNRKNETMASVYQQLSDNPTDNNILLGFFGNIILEGLYFYAGFAYLYTLSRSGKMLCSTQMIRFINRDENCLSLDTDVLTSNGWKNIVDVTIEDEVAQYDMDTEDITFVKPLRKIYKDFKGTMYKIVDQQDKILQNITDDHDIVIEISDHQNEVYGTKKAKAKDVKFNISTSLINSGFGVGTKTHLTNYEKLLIALEMNKIINLKRSNKNTITFRIRNKENVLLLNKIINDCGLLFSSDNYNKPYIIYNINITDQLPFDKNFDWVKLNEIESSWCHEFLDELVRWDSPKEHNFLSYTNTNKAPYDKVMSILSLSGYKFKSSTPTDTHGISWWTHTNNIPTQVLRKVPYEYDGKVGCVTMPKGTIITRSVDGYVNITGNCHLVLYKNIIKEMRKERPELFTEEFNATVYNMFREATDIEKEWGKYISGDGLLGLTDNIINDYVEHICDDRLRLVGMDALFGDKPNPIKWVEDYSKFNDQKTNFFENSVSNYSKGSVDMNDF